MNIQTLRKRADFLRLNKGRKIVAPYIILRYAPNASDAVRVGYTVTTKCGNAVQRNRIKRRLRSLMRELMPTLGRKSTDYVLIARAEMAQQLCEDDYQKLRAAMEHALTKASGCVLI